jgi:cell division protein FtsA
VVQNLLYCIKRCDLELAGIASSAYVAGISLVEDEQELGAACIDMGGGSTGLSIFIKKHMIYADCRADGRRPCHLDISKGLQVPLDGGRADQDAARRGARHRHGRPRDDRDRRRHRRLGKGPPQVSRTELIGIMRPGSRRSWKRCAPAGRGRLRHLPSQQIVLTGGGSQIPGLDGLATRILGQQVRLGRPLRVQGLPQAATGAAFASAVGLCLFAAHPQDEWWDFEIPADATRRGR